MPLFGVHGPVPSPHPRAPLTLSAVRNRASCHIQIALAPAARADEKFLRWSVAFLGDPPVPPAVRKKKRAAARAIPRNQTPDNWGERNHAQLRAEKTPAPPHP